MVGTLINVGTVLAGTAIGTAVGPRLPERIQQRVLAGLGMITLVDRDRPRARLGRRGHVDLDAALRARAGSCSAASSARRSGSSGGWRRSATACRRGSPATDGHSTVSEGFVTASLLFCVGSLTVVGSIQDGLTGDYELLATKAVLDGFAAIALAATLGWGVGLRP